MPSCREVIDPQSTLPSIELENNIFYPPRPAQLHKNQLWNERYYVRSNDQRVGEAWLTSFYNEAWFDYVQVNVTGIGLGLATYIKSIELAHERTLAFKTGDSLTEPAVKIWQYLSRVGVAQEFIPFSKPGGVYEDRHFGIYRIDPVMDEF